jgi:signal transduction histidine kinase
MNPRIKLEDLIFRHYARSALLSILTIELLLLAMYFGINAYNGRETGRTIKAEVAHVMPGLVMQSASTINANLEAVTRATRQFADVHTDLFANADSYVQRGPKPEFAKAPNDSYYQSTPTTGSSLYFPATAQPTAREWLIAEKSALLDPLYVHTVRDTPNVVAAYINTPGDMNRLYPFMEKVWEQYPPDLNMEDYNFFYLADPKHNPERKPVWTGVYLDPAGQGWMLSCITPVYQGDTFEGVVGLDVTTEKIVNNVLKMDLPWQAAAFLAEENGMILAMPGPVEALFGLTELKSHVYSSAISKEQLKPQDFNLFGMKDPELVERFKDILANQRTLSTIPTKDGPAFLVQGIIPETGWRVCVVIKEADVFASLDKLMWITRVIGYGAIAVMLAFYVGFFVFLRRKARLMASRIAAPVEELAGATIRMGTDRADAKIPYCGISELDQLTDNFNTMSGELDQRSKDLVAAGMKVAMTEKEAEISYTKGLYESASGYLHNVGNAMSRMESCLMDFGRILRSTRQYPEVFRILRGGGPDAPATLDKFESVLLEKTVPAISEATANMSRIKDSIKQTIHHQQSGFMAATRRMPPEDFDFSDACHTLEQTFAEDARAKNVGLTCEIEPGVRLSGHREPLLQGVENLLRNALDASAPGGMIRLSCKAVPGGAALEVADHGCGIRKEDLGRVMTVGFTTKADGHGLGLHSFAVFLSSTSGRLELFSEGPGQGTTAKADIRHAKPNDSDS